MSKEFNRRQLLTAGIGVGGAMVSAQTIYPKESLAKDRDCLVERQHSFGHGPLLMEEYHQGTMEILGRLSGELDQVGDLTSRAARVIRNGGTVWTSMDDGHMPVAEQSQARRGNPGILKNHKGLDFKTFEKLQSGDMVFTNQCNRAVLRARDRGVYVVAVTVNYIDNEFRPAGFTNPNEDNLMLKDVSNEVLHSHVPYYQGLVHAPQIPEMTLCPSTTTGSSTLHWMLTAEIANKLWTASSKKVDKSAEYLRILTERIEKTKEHWNSIRQVAVEMTRRIRQGGRWFVRSLEHPGFQSELHGVASGPSIVNWGDWEKSKMHNVMLINAISPGYPTEIKLAQEKQVEGAYVIGIGPDSLDGESAHGRLIDVADVGFNNFSSELEGIIKIPGSPKQICPTSGIVGNVIQQMICAQWTDEMVRRGSVPYFWMGYFQAGGRPYYNAINPFFESRGF